jgi:hypothetical protein
MIIRPASRVHVGIGVPRYPRARRVCGLLQCSIDFWRKCCRPSSVDIIDSFSGFVKQVWSRSGQVVSGWRRRQRTRISALATFSPVGFDQPAPVFLDVVRRLTLSISSSGFGHLWLPRQHPGCIMSATSPYSKDHSSPSRHHLPTRPSRHAEARKASRTSSRPAFPLP